jgi:hypothetical protein
MSLTETMGCTLVPLDEARRRIGVEILKQKSPIAVLTMCRLRQNGLPVVEFGGRIYVRMEAVVEYFLQHEGRGSCLPKVRRTGATKAGRPRKEKQVTPLAEQAEQAIPRPPKRPRGRPRKNPGNLQRVS